MSETFSNSNPSTYSTPVAPVAPAGTGTTSTTPTVTQPSQEPKTVDMTVPGNSETTVQETPVVKEGFDSDKITLSNSYISKFMANINKATGGIENENGDILDAYHSVGDQEVLTGIFKRTILHNQKDLNRYRESQNLFATLDNTNYTYSSHPILGNIRTPIDENGKPIGLPEAIDKNGNPIDYTNKHLHDYDYSLA